MSGWLDNIGTRHGLIIIAAVCCIIAVAFGLIESVLAQSFSIEVLFIFALVLPALGLPALAFRTHSKDKKRSEVIIEIKNRQLNEVLENMAHGLYVR